MRRNFLWIYQILSWLILLIIFLIIFLFFVLESPSTIFKILEKPLKNYGIEYGEIEGSLLSGFMLKNINYNNEIKVDKVALKIDFNQLQNRVLYVDNLVLENLEIEKDFLASLLDDNSSSESNNTLPFDEIIVNNADISLKNIIYNEYKINKSRIKIEYLESDMKEKHKGKLSFMLDSNVSKVDLNATFKNKEYVVEASIEGERLFIEPFLSEQNVTLLSNPKVILKAKGNLEELDYDLKIKRLDAKHNEYEIHTRKFHTFGHYNIEKKDLLTTVKIDISSNVGKLELSTDVSLNMDDLNNTLVFEIESFFEPKQSHLLTGIEEQNISIESFPSIKIFAKGNMENVDFSTKIIGLKAQQNNVVLNLKDLDLKGKYSPLKGDTDIVLLTNFDSSVADGFVDLKSKFKFNDLNNTLVFDLKSDLKVHESYLNPFLEESNVTLNGDSSLKILAKGGMKKVNFSLLLKKLKGKQNKIDFNLQELSLEGYTKPLDGDTKVHASTYFNSSIADGKIEGNIGLNFNDVNNTLKLDTLTRLDVHAKYLNPLLKEQKMSIAGNTHIEVKAKGSMENLLVNIDAETQVLKDNKRSNVSIHSSSIVLNLLNSQVDGSVEIKSDGEELGLNIKTKFSGDYTKPKEMNIENKIELGHFNALGLDLSSLKPLKVDIQNGANGLVVNLTSPKLKLHAKSSDNDYFIFDLKTEAIEIDQIIKVPKELKNKFVKLDIRGDITVSKQYFNIKGNLGSNKGFKVNLDAKNNALGLDAKLYTKHFKFTAMGNIETKNIKAKIEIDSLKKVQKEFHALYDFTPINVDGSLELNSKLKGEDFSSVLSSPKLKFEGFNLEKLTIESSYKKELLTFNTLSFNTTGFKEKSLNQKFYLNKKAFVFLGEKKELSFDIHPKIKLFGKGNSEKLKATVEVEALPIGYTDYGHTKLSCNIDYIVEGKKKKIIGGVFLDKLKIFYESKFLDPSHDNDVVIINRNKRLKELEDSFLNDTFIDLGIYTEGANYKTKDIDLKFNLHIKAQKEFRNPLRLLGKIDEINGRVEQSPKLFLVVDSSIVFQGGEKVNPLLDLSVEYRLPDIVITIGINGNAKRPKITFTSEPPLPKKDILSYLLLGVSTANLGEGKGSLGREAQLFIMNQAARDLAYEVELDRVFVKDDGTGEGYAVQVGKKINDDTMLIIENSTEGNSFILEYDVSKNIKIEVGQHQKTVPSQSIDIFFRKKFK